MSDELVLSSIFIILHEAHFTFPSDERLLSQVTYFSKSHSSHIPNEDALGLSGEDQGADGLVEIREGNHVFYVIPLD